MMLYMILLLLAGIQRTEGLEEMDNNLNFFKTSCNKTNYNGVNFGNIKIFYMMLCNHTTQSYELTLVPVDKLNRFRRDFPPDYDPDLYLTSYQCERNDAFYFICQRMLKTHVPHKEQRWYNFHMDNTSCSLDGITVLSGVNQILENNHFIDITVDSVLQCQRQAVESQANKESTSCYKPSEFQPQATLQSTALAITSSVSTTTSSKEVTTPSTGILLLTSMSSLPPASSFDFSTSPLSRSREMSMSDFFASEADTILISTSSLSIGAMPSQIWRMETAGTYCNTCQGHIPVYIYIIIGTLSISTVVLSVVTFFSMLKRRQPNWPGSFLLKEQHGKIMDDASDLNAYTDLPAGDLIPNTENTINN